MSAGYINRHAFVFAMYTEQRLSLCLLRIIYFQKRFIHLNRTTLAGFGLWHSVRVYVA